jgi:hypothetical protein
MSNSLVVSAISSALPVFKARAHAWHPMATGKNVANLANFAKTANYGKSGFWSSIG